MIKVDTTITCPQSFNTKSKFKNYLVDNFVNEKIDPLRIYNFKLMKQYGDWFFYLIFKHPNVGILNHIYQTEDEYEKSIELKAAGKRKRLIRRKDEILESHKKDFEEKEKQKEKAKNDKIV